MFLKSIILSIAFVGSSHVIMAQDSMPIIAYMGVPDWKTSDENFKTLSECGFTVSLYPYASLNLLVKACRSAEKYGVRVLGRCSEMFDTPAKAAQTLKAEKGFYGYFLQDEPNVPQIRERQKEIEALKRVDSTHCFYINLLPCINPDWVQSSTKAKNYPEYLRAASSTDIQQISFDYYPITSDGVRQTWYNNLEMVRRESIASGKPFWAFTLSVPHDVPSSDTRKYPMPTMASLRLQIYSNLAYGAQAIQYFTYWTPGKNEGYNYHDAPISREGVKTKTYNLVRQMNAELKSVASLFYKAKVTNVSHMGKKLPEGTRHLETMPLNIRGIITNGRDGAVVSQFEKAGHKYLAIVNKSLKSTLKVEIDTFNDQPVQVTKSLSTVPMQRKYAVTAGDMIVFKLR